MAIDIRKMDSSDERVGKFVGELFEAYADKKEVICDYVDYCFVAKDGDRIVGVVTGHAYYREVHIGDLIVAEDCRGQDIGTKLIRRVEEEFKDRDIDNINLTTYGFQAPEFYKKLGYEVEYIRESADPKLTKYFYIKRV